jgi:hypothetical protein
MPLEHSGTMQFSFSPLATTLALSRIVEAGVAADLAFANDSKADVAIGPEIRVAIPKATAGLDIQKVIAGKGSRLRIFFLTSF